MALFPTRPERLSLTLRALARLIGYPDAELRAHLGELSDALRDERVLTTTRLAEIDRLLDELRAARPLVAEAAYVELFDRGRRTALHLFEHVHGDSRDRGPAMVDLVAMYEQAGLRLAPGELPDHLAVALEYASTQPPEAARAFLRELAHIVQAIFTALLQRGSAYACVPGALLDLAGERAQPVELPDEPSIDEAWEEPPVFGGCSTAGQDRPGQPQPIQIHRPQPKGVRA